MGSALSDDRHQCIIAKKPFFRQRNDLRGIKDDRTVWFGMGQVTIVHGQLAQIHSPRPYTLITVISLMAPIVLLGPCPHEGVALFGITKCAEIEEL